MILLSIQAWAPVHSLVVRTANVEQVQKSLAAATKNARAIGLMLALLFAAPARGQLFESDSKRFSNSKMDIVVKEIDRRQRSSVVQIDIKSIGSSVGSSFFLLCSIRQLALQRGNFRYIVKIEEKPKPGQMIVGFLREPGDDPTALGPEFKAIEKAIIDLEEFAPICDAMK
jgi:hypothetical protein